MEIRAGAPVEPAGAMKQRARSLAIAVDRRRPCTSGRAEMSIDFNGVTIRLTVCGLHELHQLHDADVTHVVSILDPSPEPDAAFRPPSMHERLDLRFHDIIDDEEGMVSPQREDIVRLLEFGRKIWKGAHAEAHLLVYCHAGVSRSTAAMTLLLAHAMPDQPAQAAIDRMLQLRPYAWPNLRMIEIGDALLGCDGSLIAAVRRRYADMIRRYPELGRAIGRTRHLRD